jgi:DNA-binding response OmpR family regulator
MTPLADGQRILIVEDDEKNVKLVRDLLDYHGFRTLVATDADGRGAAGGSGPLTVNYWTAEPSQFCY